MEFTPRETAHILAALRHCAKADITQFGHFDGVERGQLSEAKVDALAERINMEEQTDGHYTVVGIMPDSDWDSCMRDATFVDFVEADNVLAAAQAARLQVAWRRLVFENEEDEAANSKRVEEYASTIEIVGIFVGHMPDLYDPGSEN